MNNKIRKIIILTCLLCLISKVSSGVICYPACLLYCAANPLMFAGILASGGIVQMGCLTGCGLACSTGLFIPASCFSEDTILKVKENNNTLEKEIKNINRDDYVLTLNTNGKQIYTKVINNIKSNGDFNFVDIICKANSKNYELKVTEEHALIIKKDEHKKIVLAKNLKVGMKFFMENGLCEIKEIKQIILKDKYTLITEDGTVLSSGIYSSTICDSDVDENLTFEQNLEKWKKNHNFISSIKN